MFHSFLLLAFLKSRSVACDRATFVYAISWTDLNV